MTDRVKQSIFDIITPRISDAVVYDCFAGTGSMGLECLSRGADRVTFFETDRGASERLRENIRTLKVEDRSVVITPDLFRWIEDPKMGGAATPLLLDPPYRYLREQPDQVREHRKALGRTASRSRHNHRFPTRGGRLARSATLSTRGRTNLRRNERRIPSPPALSAIDPRPLASLSD